MGPGGPVLVSATRPTTEGTAPARPAERREPAAISRASGGWLAAVLLGLLVLAGWLSLGISGGRTGADLAILSRAEAVAQWELGARSAWPLKWEPRTAWVELWDVGASGDGWLSGAWTTVSRLLWSGLLGAREGSVAERAGPALAFRLEQIALLAASGVCLALLVRRVSSPWFGRDHARAAGFGACLLLLAHPLGWMAGLGMEFRGALLALALSVAALLAYLRARQERRAGGWMLAATLALLAGASHAQAWALPPLAALVEYASARRYRPVLSRARTAATTLLLCAACVGAEPLLRALCGPAGAAQPGAQWLGALGAAGVWSDTAARVAWSLFPVNLADASVGAGLLAGALWLCALQPALLASRHAPRLWGGALLAAAVALFTGVLVIGPQSAGPEDLSHAAAHLLTLPALATTLGLGGTALSGRWRAFVPVLTVVLCAALSFANLRGLTRVQHESAEFVAALERVRTLYGSGTRLVVVEPPRVSGGLGCSGSRLDALLDPERGPAPRIDGPTRAALLAWARSGGLESARRAGDLVVLVRAEELGRAGREWTTLVLPARAAPHEPAPIVWRGDGRSPDLTVDPTRYSVLRVQAAAEGATRSAAVSWRASNEVVGVGRLEVASNAAQFRFDLSDSLSWVLSGEVRRLWLEGALVRMEEAVLEREPELVLPGRWNGERVHIDVQSLATPPPEGLENTARVELLDLKRLELVGVPARLSAVGGEYSARVGAARRSSSLRAWLSWPAVGGGRSRARVELAD